MKTTPFLDELAENSLLVERAYTTVPRTSKATISVNCGIQPHLVEEITEARSGGTPARGLADLLKEQGYSTAFFQSSTELFEIFRGCRRPPGASLSNLRSDDEPDTPPLLLRQRRS